MANLKSEWIPLRSTDPKELCELIEAHEANFDYTVVAITQGTDVDGDGKDVFTAFLRRPR